MIHVETRCEILLDTMREKRIRAGYTSFESLIQFEYVFKTHCTIIWDIIHNRMREKVLGSGISHLNLHPFRGCIIAGIHECLYGVVKWLGV